MWSNQLPDVVIITITATPLWSVSQLLARVTSSVLRDSSQLLLYLGGCLGPGEDGAHLGPQSIGLGGA